MNIAAKDSSVVANARREPWRLDNGDAVRVGADRSRDEVADLRQLGDAPRGRAAEDILARARAAARDRRRRSRCGRPAHTPRSGRASRTAPSAPGGGAARQLAPQVVSQRSVERRKRLVEQQERWLRRERARQRDALLLAAGDLPRAAPFEALQAEHLDRDAPRALRAASPAAMRERELDVLGDGHVRKERQLLHDVADAAILRRQVDLRLAVERDCARRAARCDRDRA